MLRIKKNKKPNIKIYNDVLEPEIKQPKKVNIAMANNAYFFIIALVPNDKMKQTKETKAIVEPNWLASEKDENARNCPFKIGER